MPGPPSGSATTPAHCSILPPVWADIPLSWRSRSRLEGWLSRGSPCPSPDGRTPRSRAAIPRTPRPGCVAPFRSAVDPAARRSRRPRTRDQLRTSLARWVSRRRHRARPVVLQRRCLARWRGVTRSRAVVGPTSREGARSYCGDRRRGAGSPGCPRCSDLGHARGRLAVVLRRDAAVGHGPRQDGHPRPVHRLGGDDRAAEEPRAGCSPRGRS